MKKNTIKAGGSTATKCWVGDGVGDTPLTVTTTRAPAVLKTFIFLKRPYISVRGWFLGPQTTVCSNYPSHYLLSGSVFVFVCAFAFLCAFVVLCFFVFDFVRCGLVRCVATIPALIYIPMPSPRPLWPMVQPQIGLAGEATILCVTCLVGSWLVG